MEKIIPISLKLNFTPNNSGCYGLKRDFNARVGYLLNCRADRHVTHLYVWRLQRTYMVSISMQNCRAIKEGTLLLRQTSTHVRLLDAKLSDE